jgi:hypothetical protein
MVFFELPKQAFFSNPFVRVLVIERRFKLKLPFNNLESFLQWKQFYDIVLDVHAQLSPPLGLRWSKDFIPKSCIDTYSLLMGKPKQNPNAIYE